MSMRSRATEHLNDTEHSLRGAAPGAARIAAARGHDGGSRTVEVGGVRITHPDRMMYPAVGLTKEDLARYYLAIAPRMLPEVRGRPLTLVQCPGGAEAPCAYMRHLRVRCLPALRHVAIRQKAGMGDYLVADTAEALVALVQMDVLEVHTWNARVEELERPDRIIFDLDPGPGVAWSRLVDAARRIRALLEDLGMRSFVKTTGGKALHVVVPLTTRASWGECLEFSRAVAQAIERSDPAAFTSSMVKSVRPGRIYVDYLRNHRAASSIAAYSGRARLQATVSYPLRWDELTGELRPEAFIIPSVLAAVGRSDPDPWEGYDRVKQRLRSSMIRDLQRSAARS
jgi:bifunctional non-homologous end joining protein LigD